MNKAILWDLDGTLLYTLQDLTNATNATLRAFGLAERSLEEVRTFVGNGAIQQMRRAVGGEPENFQEIMAYYRAYYPQHCNETTRPYAGILDTATALQAAGWRLAIVSNKPDNATKALWKTYFPTFDLALGEGPDLPRKPAPDMVLRALEQLEENIRQYRQAIQSGDLEGLSEKLARSSARKRKMNRMEASSGAVGRDRWEGSRDGAMTSES